MAPLAGTSLRRKQSTCRVWRPALVVLPALLGAAVASPATIQSGGPGGVSMLFAARVATPIRLVVDPMVERVRSEVTIRIDARTRLASFEVLEEFRNNAGRVLEGDYLYAIPRGAVFHNLSLFAGENEMRGEMLQAEQARAIYEEIVRKRRDPALVELAGRDLIRARVFPIEPGDTRRIILRYAQVLPLLGDALRMQFPRTASVMDLRGDGPQGFPEPRADIRRATPTAPALASAVHVRIEHASMLGTPYSPTDAIDVVRRDGSLVEVRLLENERRPGRAAFELLLPRLGSTIGASLLAHAPDPGSEDGYFLLLLNPPAADTTETIARDVSLVLDVSGSMAGHKIEQARSALEQLLRGLRLHDRFRLITFSSAVRSYEPTYVSASPENIALAIEYLRRVPADGSTNIDGALRAALEPQVAEGRLSMVLFLTDGLPTVGETDPVRISAAAEQLRDGERVFAFGVGDDVNTYLLDRLVEAGRGTVDYVRAGENVESAVAALGRRIGAPVLSDLRIVSAPATIEDLHPTPLPDLFHGQELVVTGRYRGGGVGSLVLEGERAGRRERFAFDVDFPHRQRDNEYVARLWASRKVGALTAQLRLHGPDRELIEEIRTLGLRYGVLTEYTSYLVQEPHLADDREEAQRRARRLARPPAEQTGETALRQALVSSRLRAAASVSEADEVMAAAPLVGGRASKASSWRRAGRRLFVETSDGLRDVRADSGLPAISVASYSHDWFELQRQFPGLKHALALGESVIIAGEGLVLRIESGGAPLGVADWSLLRRAFAAEAR